MKGVRMWTERVIFSVRECAEGGCGGAGEKGRRESECGRSG